MIIRDLTLRSAASFGSFHLIRLLYDEYMFYLVEHKVSKAIGASPISVMGEVRTNLVKYIIYTCFYHFGLFVLVCWPWISPCNGS